MPLGSWHIFLLGTLTFIVVHSARLFSRLNLSRADHGLELKEKDAVSRFDSISISFVSNLPWETNTMHNVSKGEENFLPQYEKVQLASSYADSHVKTSKRASSSGRIILRHQEHYPSFPANAKPSYDATQSSSSSTLETKFTFISEVEATAENALYLVSAEPPFHTLSDGEPHKENYYEPSSSFQPEPSRAIVMPNPMESPSPVSSAKPIQFLPTISQVPSRRPFARESASPTAVASEDKDLVNQSLTPNRHAGRENYKILLVGRTIVCQLRPGSNIYHGPRLNLDSSWKHADIVLQFRDESITSSSGTSTRNEEQGAQHKYPNSINGLRVNITSKRNESHGTLSFAEPGMELYAFSNDPQSMNPGLIAASSTLSKNQTFSGRHDVTMQIPVFNTEKIYFLLSVGISSARTDIIVSSNTVRLGPPRQPSWNTQTTLAEVIPSAHGKQSNKNYVYVLSSAPYKSHSELKDKDLDLFGISYLSESRGTRHMDPFCKSRGTEIVSALIGKSLGSAVDTTVIPLVIEGCNRTASIPALRKELDWVHEDIDRKKTNSRFFVIIDVSEHAKDLASSLPTVVREASLDRAIVLIPASTCYPPDRSYLLVGPYGIRGDKDLEIPSLGGPCEDDFDIFSPGLRVQSADTSGPYSYRFRSINPGLAAAGAVTVITNAVRDGDLIIDLLKLKGILKKKFKLSKAYVGNSIDGNYSKFLPIFGPKSSKQLKTILQLEGANSSNAVLGEQDKNASTSARGLPRSALIGICISAGIIAVAVLIGGIFLSRHREGGQSPAIRSEGDDADPTERKREREHGNPQDIVGQGSRDAQDGPNQSNSNSSITSSLETGQKIAGHPHTTLASQICPPAQGARAALDKASPQLTQSEKASWFATPTNAQQGSESRFESVSTEAFAECNSETIVQIDTTDGIEVFTSSNDRRRL